MSDDAVQPAQGAPLILASASPRREQLLREAGIALRVHRPDIDDGQLRCGAVPPEQWVMALAYLKARRVHELLQVHSEVVLGADTVCVHQGVIFGQPIDAEQARSMLIKLRNATHETITGVCLLSDRQRLLFGDRAQVRMGDVTDEQLNAYIASGKWRGKAGGYNLAEQIAAGWPIECVGDPATVIGLPMQRLRPLLRPSMM